MNHLVRITNELSEVAREVLSEEDRQRSGRVLYCPVDTLVSESQIYFLGANPGEVPGSTVSHNLYTVESDIERLKQHSIKKHAYLDESWKNLPIGEEKMQVRAKMIFKILAGGDSTAGVNLFRNTPTGNLIFFRSTDIEQLEQSYGQTRADIAEKCWPFHLKLIDLVKPKIILTHALSVAKGLADNLGFELIGEFPSGHADWTCCAWSLSGGQKFLAIPNLSRYKPSGVKEVKIKEFFSEFFQDL